jgi:hypothetical protein
MFKSFKAVMIAGSLLIVTDPIARAQFSSQHPDGVPMPSVEQQVVKDRVGGPVAIGQAMAQKDEGGKVAIVQAPTSSSGGGFIQLSAFGWLEPYVDSVVQALITAGLAWFAKSKYSSMMDESARAAFETFLKNSASSLIADGAVKLENKTLKVDSPTLYQAAREAETRIPEALKRFNLTPEVVAARIVDAIPQVSAGAAIIATAHAPPPQTVNVVHTSNGALGNPPVSAGDAS